MREEAECEIDMEISEYKKLGRVTDKFGNIRPIKKMMVE